MTSDVRPETSPKVAAPSAARRSPQVALTERYRPIFESCTEGIALHEIILDEAGRPIDYRFLVASPAFEAQTGLELDDVIGHCASEILPGIEQTGLTDIYGHVALTGEPARFTTYVELLDRYYDITAFSPDHGTFAALYVDISDQVRAQEALRGSEKRYRALVDTTPDYIYSLDTEGRHTAVNQALCRDMGLLAEEIIGKNHSELGFPPEIVEEWRGLYRRVLIDGETVETEATTPMPDGLLRSYEVVLRPIRDEQGTIAGIHCVSRNTTACKRAEAALQHVNQVFRTVSGINQMMIREKNPEALLSEACRIFIDIGGFRLAWIGRRDRKSKRVVPVARAGVDEGYLESIELRFDESPQGRGSTGRALWSERPVVCEDVLADPDFAPWREAAAARGFRSSVAVPIRLGRSTHGILEVYAAKPAAFPREEIAQFEELADNLAFALEAIETAAARDRAERHQRNTLNRLRRSVDAAVKALAHTVEIRDPYTAGHQERVTRLALALGKSLGLRKPEMTSLRIASLVHDIGKMAIPAEILSKPTSLNDAEWQLLRSHPETGYEILHEMKFPGPVAKIVLQHHERLDGSGYPHGLSGDEICREARIIAVADVVEAMSSHRPYRPALGTEAALDYIISDKGRLFDARVVEACSRVFDKGFTLTA